MVLVEVLELIVDVDRSLNFGVYFEFNLALVLAGVRLTPNMFGDATASLVDRDIVLNDRILDFVAHDVEDDAKGEENDAKHGKDYHGGAEGGHGSPGGQHLLLEFALLQFIDF